MEELQALFALSLPWDRATLPDYTKLAWQPACVWCQAWGRVCVQSHAHVYTYLSFSVQKWCTSHAWHYGTACAFICVCSCKCPVHRPALREHKTGKWILVPSFGTHQFVTCEKRQSEDCKWAGHSSQVCPWDPVTPVITAYSEDLLHTTSSLASPLPPTNRGNREKWEGGGGFIDPLFLCSPYW